MPPTDTSEDTATAPAPSRVLDTRAADLLVCLPALPPSTLTASLETLAAAFPAQHFLVASPHQNDEEDPTLGPFPRITILPYPTDRANLGWVLAASDYSGAARLAADRLNQAHTPSTLLILADAPTLAGAPLLHALAASIRSNIDLAVPRFRLGPSDGLVNAALLYPLNRALFGVDIRFPLPAAVAVSARMSQRLASVAQRLVAVNQGTSLFWPVAEAAIAGFSVREVDAAESSPPSPPHEDFNELFAGVAGSLFSDIEARASFWQRARALHTPSNPAVSLPPLQPEAVSPDIQTIIENFQLAQNNLQEIWSLVLPPQSRLAFKKLAQLPAATFAMDPALWARTVYDFALAFHLRTLNRNHLLGAMTPLYLAWAASYLRAVDDDPTRAAHAIEQTAAAFETEKPYFLSRWRWPDRFNP